MPTILNTLRERGFIQQLSHPQEIEELFARERVTCYLGIDPTADSLHVGHLLPVMLLMHLQRAGHRPLLVVGGGTVTVGDPSGKTEMRSLISFEEIEYNKGCLKKQLAPMLDFSPGEAVMLDNADWLLPLNYISFLREIGAHFSVNRMLQADCYRTRMERPDGGLSFIELNYMIMQSYDFLVLYREYGCKVQVGGDDQWSNILSGADLIRRLERGEAHALTIPLLETSDGKKMGKTEAGAVWLDPNRTSPYEFYQYWRNVHDGDVAKLLALYTLMPMTEISALCREGGSTLNEAKKVLAHQVTALIHGEAAAEAAAQAAAALFGGSGDHSAMPTTLLTAEELTVGVNIVDLLVRTGLCESKSEARRLVQQNGATVNGERVNSIEQLVTADDLREGMIILRKGRKDYHAVKV
ncbi:MAG: tyrosine--tRNA ligase [Symbiobacteriaceae bacterium]|nr:tyrosine--tRNA ligase [Symbiobacteriaceae bacterium]